MIQIIVKLDVLSEQDKQLISRLMSAVELSNYNILNIKYYRLDLTANFYITFGEQATIATKLHIPFDKILSLPDINKLYNEDKNYDNRAKTYHQLKELSTYINKQNLDKPLLSNILFEHLPNISIDALLELKNELDQDGISGITVLNSQGQKIRIVINNNDIKTENISITLSELIAINLAKNAFGLKGLVEITQNNKEK